MNKFIWIVVVVVVVGLGVFAYLKFSAPSPAPEPFVIANQLTEPVAASSYGKGELGDASGRKIEPSNITPQEVGILQGTAKPGPGAQPNFEAITVSISDPQTNAVLDSASLGADRSYKFIVAPGEYVLKISGSVSDQLPMRIYIGAGQTQNVNFFVK